jgi:hydroxymethylglutaryl-CoA synthase
VTVGIIAHGAYIPATRLPAGRGEKAVAGHDEDAVTLAVAAGIDALRGFDRSKIDALLFASTTAPFAEKQSAAVVARALDLGRDVATVDYGGSLRSGTSALRAGFDAIRAGSARNALVVVSDCRSGAGPLEAKLGEAAAAFIVSDGDALATLDASHAVADEILDVWRAEGDAAPRAWEERFVVKHGARANLVAAVAALAKQTGRASADYDRAVLYGYDAKEHAALVRALKLDAARVEDPLFGKVGNAGAAFVPLLLVAALEKARPGERILAASYGDGAEALAFTVTAHAQKPRASRGVAGHLARRRAAKPGPYWAARKALAAAPAAGGVSATKHWREREEDLGLVARACRGCGTLHFPAQRVCIRCFKKDDFERARLSDRPGKLLSHTVDHFFPNPEPPTLAGVVEIEGGCRIWLQITEASVEELALDLPLELTFRRIHKAGGWPNYYWKGTPLR